jgi:hypothetical protein
MPRPPAPGGGRGTPGLSGRSFRTSRPATTVRRKQLRCIRNVDMFVLLAAHVTRLHSKGSKGPAVHSASECHPERSEGPAVRSASLHLPPVAKFLSHCDHYCSVRASETSTLAAAAIPPKILFLEKKRPFPMVKQMPCACRRRHKETGI